MPTPCSFDLFTLRHDPTCWGVVFATPSQYDMLNDIMYDEQDRPLKSIMTTATVEPSKAAAFRSSIDNGEMIPPPGTLVAWLTPLLGYALLAEDEVEFTGRLFLRGDLVVSDERPGQTGIVQHSKTSCSLQTPWNIKHKDHPQAISCMPRESFAEADKTLTLTDNGVVTDIDLSDLETSTSLHVGAGVMYQGWAGIVLTVDEEKTIRLFNNTVVVLDHEVKISHLGEIRPEESIQVFELGSVISARKTDLRLGRWLFGRYDASLAPLGVVINLRPTRVRVEWQAHQSDRWSVDIDRTLQPPADYLGLDELDSPSFFVNNSGRSYPYNTPHETTASGLLVPHIRFVDPEKARAKYGSRPNASKLFQNGRQANLGFDMNIFRIAAINSTVTVRWQDASVTTHPSLHVLKTEPTENNVYHPGTLVCTSEMKPLSENPTAGFADAPRKIGVVQTCDQNKCLAMVRWFKNPRFYLEKDKDYGALPDYYCGELCEDQEAVSTYDLVQPGGLDFVAYDFVRLRNFGPNSSSDENGWLGFITDIHPDATVSVWFESPKGRKIVRVPVDDIEIALDVEASSMNPYWHNGDQHMSDGSETGYSTGSDISMESREDVGAILMGDRQETVDYIMDESGDPLDGAASEHSSAWSTASEGVAEQNGIAAPILPPPTNGQQADGAAEHATSTTQYVLHDGPAPDYHRFASEAGQLSTAGLRKVMKEHTILSNKSAIPQGIYVHSWEGNCNILRALIVGPTETPYAYCPFLFDILLPPSYPTKPPRVFFAHWRNSLSGPDRRINPNLYEDGTVCLSLLNTWPGESTEGWMPGKSTLLQILISIQSLILVPEPYYNEPGFEAKRQVTGTKDSSVAYNEQTLLQARGFLLHSLTETKEAMDKNIPRTQLTDTIEHIYWSPNGPDYLQKLIHDDTALIQRSEAADEDTQRQRNGVDIISPGACLRLKRMLQSLQTMVPSIDEKVA